MAALFFAGFFTVVNGIYHHPALILTGLLDCAGLFFTFLLVQKSLHIKSKTGDAVCGVIEKGGCDDVLASKGSTFMGLFGWSEVGFAYFSVSLMALLLFPQAWGALALCNAVCLPFSFWSIWYQKTRVKAWCTMCLSVQATLWCLFFCYLAGGVLKEAWPPTAAVLALGAAYVGALLGLNRLMPLIERNDDINSNETDIAS